MKSFSAARDTLFGECFLHSAKDLNDPVANLRWRWIVEGHWKLLVPAPQNEPGAQPELYDLAADPKEEKNLASAQPGKVASDARTQEAEGCEPARTGHHFVLGNERTERE